MKIIAFVDGSTYSASVCDYAAWAAERMQANIDLFHILGRRRPGQAPADLSGSLKLGARSALLEELAKADEEWARLAQARGRAVLEDATSRIQDAASGLDVQSRLRNDDLVETLHTFEEEANLVIVGKRGEASAFAKDHLGSNLERTLRSAHKPVLVTNQTFRPINRCLIAYDGGPSSNKAIDMIAESRLFKGIACTILSVASETPALMRQLEGVSALLRNAGLEASLHIRDGEPESVITEAADETGSDLLVMGAYGHSRIRNLIIGSTTTAVVRSCKRPVLMFR